LSWKLFLFCEKFLKKFFAKQFEMLENLSLMRLGWIWVGKYLE
jgi:hypothetical protein